MPSSLALCPVPTASLGQLLLPPLLPPKLTVFQGKGLIRLLSCSRSSLFELPSFKKLFEQTNIRSVLALSVFYVSNKKGSEPFTQILFRCLSGRIPHGTKFVLAEGVPV